MAESKDFRWDRWWKYTNDEIRLFAWPIVFAMIFGFFISSLYLYPNNNEDFYNRGALVFKALEQYFDLRLLYFYSLIFANFGFLANSSNISSKNEYQLANFSIPVSPKERFLSDLFFIIILIPLIHLAIYISILYFYKTFNYSIYIMIEISWYTIWYYFKAYFTSVILVLPLISIFKYKSSLLRIITILFIIVGLPIFKSLKKLINFSLWELNETKITIINDSPSFLLLIPIAILSIFLLFYSIKEKEVK